MKFTHGLLTALMAIAFTSSGALAAVTVTSSFGALPGATFGGSGISNQKVAITTIVDGNRTITLGLTATPRYSNNPEVATNGFDGSGIGTFYAVSGGDTYSGSNSNANYARWNVSFYADLGGSRSAYSVSLLFDGMNTDEGDIPSTTANVAFGRLTQNSLNLGMNTPTFFGFIPATFPGSFDPSASGQYSFALVLKKNGNEIGRSSINVNVGTGVPAAPVPDAGSSLALLGLSLSALVGIKRKLK